MHNSPGSIAAGLHVRTLGAFRAVSPIKIVYHEDLEIKEPPEAVVGSNRSGVSRPMKDKAVEELGAKPGGGVTLKISEMFKPHWTG